MKMSEPENNASLIAEAGTSQLNLSPLSRSNSQVFDSQTKPGAGREWSVWVEQFEIAADVNNWDEPLWTFDRQRQTETGVN